MIEWWHGLLLEKQIFYGIGIFSLGLLICQILLSLIGLDHHSDVGVGAAVDHDSGLGLFSLRTITAFFAGFGWTGGIRLQSRILNLCRHRGRHRCGRGFPFATSFLSSICSAFRGVETLITRMPSGRLEQFIRQSRLRKQAAASLK